MKTAMHQVWLSKGTGMSRGPRFVILRDAVRYARETRKHATVAIQLADGGWHHFEPGICILERDYSDLPLRKVR